MPHAVGSQAEDQATGSPIPQWGTYASCTGSNRFTVSDHPPSYRYVASQSAVAGEVHG